MSRRRPSARLGWVYTDAFRDAIRLGLSLADSRDYGMREVDRARGVSSTTDEGRAMRIADHVWRYTDRETRRSPETLEAIRCASEEAFGIVAAHAGVPNPSPAVRDLTRRILTERVTAARWGHARVA